MELRQQRDVAVGKAVHEVDLPQRAAAVERTGEEARDGLGEPAVVAGRPPTGGGRTRPRPGAGSAPPPPPPAPLAPPPPREAGLFLPPRAPPPDLLRGG